MKSASRLNLKFSFGLFAIGLLLTVIPALVLIYNNIQREQRHLTELFKQKGEVLINYLNIAARYQGGPDDYEHSLAELVANFENHQDILFAALTDGRGRVLSSSRPLPELPASFFQPEPRRWPDDSDQPPPPARPRPGRPPQQPLGPPPFAVGLSSGRLVLENDQAQTVFLVYRPVIAWESRRRMAKKRGHHSEEPAGRHSPPRGAPDQTYLWLAFDMDLFEKAKSANIKGAAFLISVALLGLLAGLSALFWGQNYRLSRRLYQEANALAAGLAPRLPVGLIMVNQAGLITLFNPAAEAITGLRAREAAGGTLNSLLAGGQIFPEPPAQGETERELKFKNGRQALVALSRAVLTDEAGQPLGQTILIRDLGEIGELKLRLAKAEKMAALGRVAAGIAHELRNPLGAVKGLAVYLKSRFAPDSQEAEATEVMLRSVDRLNNTVTEFLEYVKPTAIHPQPVELGQVLKRSLEFISHDAQSQAVTINRELPAEPVWARVDEGRLNQALLNLYLNALQALGGRPGARLTVELTADRAGGLRIIVADNGPGFKAEQLQNALAPYYTTKARGTGLGLALVEKIISAHGGRIQLANNPQGGGRATLTLPPEVLCEPA